MSPFLRRNEAERPQYEEAIRQHVCFHCIDCGEDGQCHSADPYGCAIYRFLPELILIAEDIKSPQLKPYQRAVRKCICTKCKADGDKKCALRTDLDCALDRYLPLVLEAIEEVDAQAENQE